MAEARHVPDKQKIQILLSDHLKCSICEDLYKEPRVLACEHTFCASCIDQNLPLDEEERTIKCCDCRTVSVLPVGGARDLPQAEGINILMELHQTQSHSKTSHQDHTSRDQYHRVSDDHVLQQDTQTQLVSIQQKMDDVSKLLDKLHTQKEATDAQGTDLKLAVTSFTQNIKDTLERSEVQQIEQVNSIVKQANDKIRDEIDCAELQYARLKTGSDYIKRQLQENGPYLTAHKEGTMKILSGIDEMVTTDELELVGQEITTITAKFHQRTDLIENCEKIGEISEATPQITPTGVFESTTCMLGKEAEIMLRLQNERPGPLTCQAIGNAGSIHCLTEESNHRPGVYRITFKPTHVGTYHFKLQKDVYCNRSTIEVCKTLRQSLVMRESLAGPVGICLSPRNMLIVNDRDGTTLRNETGSIETRCQEAVHSIRKGRAAIFSQRIGSHSR